MTDPRSNVDVLRDYFGSGSGKGPSQGDVAKLILLNAKTTNEGPGMIGPEKPSVMGRIFDILSRGNYAVANTVLEDQKKDGQDVFNAFWQGLSGKKKTTFKDVLEQGGMESGPLRSLASFGLDVFADPTTYIPFAGIASKVKGAVVKGGKVVEGAADLERPLGQRLLDQGTPINPEVFGQEAKTTAIPDILKAPVGQKLPDASKLPVTDLTPTAGKVKPGTAPGQLQFELLDLAAPTKPKKPPVGQIEPPKPKEGVQTTLKFPDLNVKAARGNAKAVQDFVNKLGNSAPEILAKVEGGNILEASKLAPKQLPIPNPKQALAADNIIAGFDPAKATAKINKKNPETLNAKQQVKLWHRARDEARKLIYSKGRNPEKVKAQTLDAAVKIYGDVEAKLAAQGMVPRIGTGENVKLSDVLSDLSQRGVPITDDLFAEFGNKIKPGSELWKSVEILRARGAITDAGTVKSIADAVGDTRAAIKASGALSDAGQKNFDEFLKSFATNQAKAMGTSPAGASAVGKLVDMTLRSGKSPAQIAIEQRAKMLDNIITTGRDRAAFNGVVTKALEKDLGKLPAWAVNDNKAVEFLMGRMATWWGQADLRPLSLDAIGSSHATAATRAKVLDGMFKGSTDAARHDAFKAAQGLLPSSSPVVSELANKISTIMDNLVGKEAGTSVITRSTVDREMVNKWLKEYQSDFQFSNKTKKLPNGDLADYSKGTDWIDSWKSYAVKEDPKTFIFKLQQAVEQATREKALFDEIGERFGSTVPGKGYRTKIEGHPYIRDYYFPDEIAKQIPRVVKDWSATQWKSNSQLLRHYDRVMSMVKSGLTIYRPAHHIRNYMGDVYLGWMDNVNGLRPYQLATQVQKSMQGAYETLADVDRLVDMGLMSRNMRTPKPNQIIFKNRSGVPFTAEQIAAVAHQKGLLESAKTLEDIIDLGHEGMQKGVLDFQPFGGKVQKVARGASELLSHNTRLAHFIDKVEKSHGNDLPKIFETAANRSRKWHPTGLDLTDFEKKYMRRILPFYSWMRKSLPLLIEGLVMNPGKTVVPAKLSDALQDMAGIQTNGRDDPFPVDQMFPQWIRDQGVGPVGLPDGLLGSFSNQEPGGYVMAGMGLNPLAELVAQLQSPGKTIASSLTPALKVPMELMMGQQAFTGEPITGYDAKPGALQEYIGEQIPIVSGVQGITGITPLGTETRKSQTSGGDAKIEALVNFLTGAGIKGTGPYVKSAVYEARKPQQAARRNQRDEFLRNLQDNLQEGS